MFTSKMLESGFVNSIISFSNICETRLSFEWQYVSDKTILKAEIYQCNFIFLHLDILNMMDVPKIIQQDFKKCYELLKVATLNEDINEELFTFVLHLFSLVCAKIIHKYTNLKNTQRTPESLQQCFQYINNSNYKIFYLDEVNRIEQEQIFSWYSIRH